MEHWSVSLGPEELLRHTAWMRRLARSLIRDFQGADDLVQDAWIELSRRPEARVGGLRPYLAGIVRNLGRQRARREGARARSEERAARDEAIPSPEAVMERLEVQRAVVELLRDLPEPQRDTILLHFVEGLSAARIARLQGAPEGTVRSRLKRGLDRLREELDRRFGGDGRAWYAALIPLAAGRDPAAAGGLGSAISALISGVVLMSTKAMLGLGALILGAVAVAWMMWPDSPEPPLRSDAAAAPSSESPHLVPGESPARVEADSGRSEDERTAASVVPSGRPGVLLRGSVEAPDESPIANASLKLYRDAEDWQEQEPLAESSSDAEGRFQIEVIPPPDDAIVIAAGAVGHQPTSRKLSAFDRAIELTLPWLVTLFGRVADAETGDPIPDARITWGTTSVLSDGDGRYRIPDARVGFRIAIRARADGYADGTAWVVIREPRETELDILLERGAPFWVQVIDRESGEAIPGAEVRIRDSDVEPFAASDDQGRLRLSVVDGMDLEIHVSADGYCPFSWRWEIKTFDSGITPRIPLVKLAWIEGVVVDAEGGPLGDVYVRSRNEEHPSGTLELAPSVKESLHLPGWAQFEVPERGENTDAEGRFLLAVIPMGSAYFVRTHHQDYVSGQVGPIVLESPSSRAWVEVVLETGATIKGRVIRNGEPFRASVEWKSPLGGSEGMTWTEEDGTYQLKNVRAGKVDVSVRDFPSIESLQEASLVVEAGEVYEQDFVWEEELARISGRVRTESGRPVEGIDVRAMSITSERGFESFEAKTGADGAYALEVPSGRVFQVSVRRELVRQEKPDVAAGSQDVDFILPDLGKLRLRLVDAVSGQPVQARRFLSQALAWRTSGTEAFQRISTELDAEGFVELGPPVGSIDLSIHFAESGYSPRVELGIPVTEDSDPAALTIELVRGIKAKIELLEEAGLGREPLEGHLLFLLEESQLSSVSGPYPERGSPSNIQINGLRMWLETPVLLNQMLLFDEMGFALVDGLDPGRYSIRSFPDDFVFEPDSFEVTEQDEAAVVVRWRRR